MSVQQSIFQPLIMRCGPYFPVKRIVDAWTLESVSFKVLGSAVDKEKRGTMLGRPWAHMKLYSHVARLVE
jgi:hypothetical protein